ncbi:MAG: NUDIX domain-containing protein [Patescibacteria group bacterium]
MSLPKEHSYGVVAVKIVAGCAQYLVVFHRSGHWGLPKGHMQEGETEVQTALRELQEEGGVSVCDILPGVSFNEQYHCTYGGIEYDKTVTYFLGIVRHEMEEYTDPDGDIIERAWLAYEDALERLTYSQKKEILIEANDYLTLHSQCYKT